MVLINHTFGHREEFSLFDKHVKALPESGSLQSEGITMELGSMKWIFKKK